jgi:hypothetical protein
MNRRTIGVMGVFRLLLLASLCWCGVVCPRTGTIFEWKFRYRIKTGMTLAVAESVLGPPAGKNPRRGWLTAEEAP